ncbi:MAG: carboxypeptidase-like regulatory domain-containing protein [Bdellovibrionales bacterium]
MLTRFFLLIILLCSAVSFAEETFEPSEFTERILLFRTKSGDLLFDGLLAHEIDRTLYVSAIDLLETLGFKTELSLDSRIFKAETLSPNIELSIIWTDCTLLRNKISLPLKCPETKIYEDELFIAIEPLGNALKASFEYLPYKSEIRISTEVDYPKLSTIKRKHKKAQVGPRVDFDPGFKRIKTEPQTFKNLFLDQQFSWGKESKKDPLFQYYTNFSTDILQHEVQITSQGDNQTSDFTTWQVKRDFYGAEKNPYLSSYQLGNVLIPTAELIGGPKQGQGFYITNRDQILINFSQREFEGNLRPEWEVELYVNDSLFERQSANENGRYRFQNIPVQYGENNFRLEFYGPLGERKTEFINNNVSSDNLKKGQFRYEAGISNDDADKTESLIQTSYGLSDKLSTYMAYTKYNLFKENQLKDYAMFGLNGYLKNFNYSLFGGADFFNQGEFYAVRSQFAVKNTRLQLTYLDAEDFKSSSIGTKNKFLDKRYKANMSTNFFGRASVLYRFEHDVFDDQSENTTAIQNIVLPIKRLTFLLQNDLVTGTSNKADVVYTYLKNQFRSSLSYDWDVAKSMNFEYRNRFKRESSLSLSYSKSFDEDSEFLKAGYQQRFQRFFLGLETSTDMNENHSVMARLRSSFGYTHSQRSPQMSSDLIASRGNVCARVFRDFNQNGILETNIDKPVKNVSLRWVQGNLDFNTDKHGEVFFGNLPMYTPLDIQLLVKSLEDPQLSPTEEGYRVHLQKGQCKELSFLLRRIYDFEGQVFFDERTAPKRVTVLLMDAYGKTLKEVRTDKEGYFLFESLPARAYYMKISEKGYTASPDIYVLNPYDQDSLEQDLYFDISKK